MDARLEPSHLVRRRITIAALMGVIAFAVIGARLFEVMIIGADPVVVVGNGAAVPLKRADLVDRNGVLIARDLPVTDLYATPSAFWDREDAASELARVSGADKARLQGLFDSEARYVLVQRALTPDMRAAVMHLGLPGLVFENRFKRYYPNGRMATQAIGLVDMDGNGVSGLELGLDALVRNTNDAVELSLDTRIQFALRDELLETSRAFQAKAAGGIVLNIHTGEVLALVSVPDFEPNLRTRSPSDSMVNRMTQDVYELGSVFKIFAFAEAIEEHSIALDEMFDIGRPFQLGRYRINDFDGHGQELSAEMVFVESSNIGTAQIGLRSGPARQQAFLSAMGLLSPLQSELPEMAAPLFPHRWGEVETATVSYGHGISVSPLAFTAAAAAIVNGGTKITPTFLKQSRPQTGERVISAQTSQTMRALMRLVVTEGTGKMADIPGYDIGGKTGTAEKPNGRGYSRKQLISSFAGIFPARDPVYLVFAMFDEPIGNKASYGFATAGWTAAPTAGRVVERIAPLLGVPRFDNRMPTAEIAAATP